jgi:2',3'-cyclic-nucleotide 2'-phosphodiesterase (5'-nucleotidase family)
MAFGVIFDFKSVNGTRVTPGAEMVKQKWFIDAVNYEEPIDVFVVIGHNPIRSNLSPGTLDLVFREIRKRKPDTPIQVFGGHTHIRDFIVYDDKSTGLESGMLLEYKFRKHTYLISRCLLRNGRLVINERSLYGRL